MERLRENIENVFTYEYLRFCSAWTNYCQARRDGRSLEEGAVTLAPAMRDALSFLGQTAMYPPDSPIRQQHQQELNEILANLQRLQQHIKTLFSNQSGFSTISGMKSDVGNHDCLVKGPIDEKVK